MSVSYRHTQFGYLIVGLLGALVAAISIPISAGAAPPVVVLSLALLLIGLLLFPTLTTEIQRERVRCYFGLGLIHREIDLHEIVSVAVVRNAWHYGWGLRRIPGGWMWNVSGLQAVELGLRGGRRFRIGTDEPEKLSAAIARSLPSTSSAA